MTTQTMTKIVYVTEDGLTFDTWTQANAHEESLKAMTREKAEQWIEDNDISKGFAEDLVQYVTGSTEEWSGYFIRGSAECREILKHLDYWTSEYAIEDDVIYFVTTNNYHDYWLEGEAVDFVNGLQRQVNETVHQIYTKVFNKEA